MKKAILFVALIGILLMPSLSHAFDEIGGLSGKVALNGLMSTAPNAEERVNLVPYLKYNRVFFSGDYMFDFNNDKAMTLHEEKTMVGVNVAYGVSLRYQYDDFFSENIVTKNVTTTVKTGNLTTKTLSTVDSTKDTFWHDNRYGVGYNFSLPVILGTTITSDTMLMKEQLFDARAEEAVTAENKYFRIRNQLYYDFTDYNMQKYWDKVTVSYKVTPYFFVTAQSQFASAVNRIDRLGITIVY
jgi:hypothetical protein